MRKIMACLDIGSDTVKCIVGEKLKKSITILAVADAPSKGIKNGVVEQPNALLESVREVISKCEEVLGLKIRQTILSVPAHNSVFHVVEGSVPITNEGDLIEGKDIIRVIKKAVTTRRSEEYEYISILPTNFILDNERVVKDPKGLTSKMLGIRGVMVSSPKKNLYPLLAVLEKLNIDVVDIISAPIGDYYAFKTKETDRSIGAIVNVGAGSTTISIFNKGVITNTNVLSVGGQNVNKDLSFIYKIPNETAEQLKRKFVDLNTNTAQTNNLKTITNTQEENIKINEYEVSEIVISQIEEILNLSKKEINHLTKKEISYIIFTGGLTECKNFKVLPEAIFKNNAVVGEIKEIGVRNNKYSTCVGLLKYYAYMQMLKNKDYSIFSIDEQQELSGANLDIHEESVIGKLFGYIFNG